MKPERIAEIRRLATPATNARQLTRLLHETLDALESITAAVQDYWTSSINLPGGTVTSGGGANLPDPIGARPTVEYAPGLAEQLLADDPAVITSAVPVPPLGTVVEKVGPEENDTRPMKRPGKERK